MILNTKLFQESANKILIAAELDKTAANLEIVTKDRILYLNVTNKEYYVSVKYNIDTDEEFRAVVDASLFLSLVSGISAETFEIVIKDNYILVKAGKSNYKLAMIYENDEIMTLPVLRLSNKTVEMPIEKNILHSILNINSKEIAKAKKALVRSEAQTLCYIDQNGAFTFTDSACLNSFTLAKPIKLLVNDRIIKLFKLFSSDPRLSFGYDLGTNGTTKAKLVLETDNIYVAALINCEDRLLDRIQKPYNATKRYFAATYPSNFVVSTNVLSAAISRLMLFSKNSGESTTQVIPGTFVFKGDEIIIQDSQHNTEIVVIENEDSYLVDNYSMTLNLIDLKTILDSYKNEHVTINCGNSQAVVVTRQNISHLLPEMISTGKN
jgi:hypothetical protein